MQTPTKITETPFTEQEIQDMLARLAELDEEHGTYSRRCPGGFLCAKNGQEESIPFEDILDYMETTRRDALYALDVTYAWLLADYFED